jgi:hypothetical protein
MVLAGHQPHGPSKAVLQQRPLGRIKKEQTVILCVSRTTSKNAPNDEEGCTRISMDGKRMNGVAYPQPQPAKRATSSLASTAPSASNSSKQFEQLFNPSNSFDVALRKASRTNLEKEQANLLRESAPLSFARPAMAAPTAGYRSAPACKGDRESTADVAAIAST